MGIFDFILLGIFALSIFLGYKFGFLRSLTGFVSLGLSIVLSMVLSPIVADMLKETTVYTAVYDAVGSAVSSGGGAQDNHTVNTTNLQVPEEFLKSMEGNLDAAKDKATNAVAATAATVAVNIISLLIVFVLVRILIGVLLRFVSLFRKLPVIGKVDAVLGGVFGLLRAFLISYIIFALIALVSFVAPGNALSESVKKSGVASMMYDNNILLDFMYQD